MIKFILDLVRKQRNYFYTEGGVKVHTTDGGRLFIKQEDLSTLVRSHEFQRQVEGIKKLRKEKGSE